MGAFHARTVAASDLIDVVAIADVDEAAAASVAAEIGAAVHSSPARMAESGDAEAWLIATPTTTHPEVVRLALEAGVHVFCEKPLALDPDESDGLGTEAESRGLLLQVGFWRRFAPPWAVARELIAAGAIGRPLLLRLSQWDADPPPAAFCDPTSSGGLAVDCGVHEFDLAEWLTGLAITRVTARNLPLVDESLAAVGDVDNLVAVLDLEGGAAATVDLSRNCRYGDDVRTEILGADGAIFIDLLPTSRTRLATGAGVETMERSVVEDAFAAGVKEQAEVFARAVRGEAVDFPGADASSRAVAIGLAVRRAATAGPVAV